MGYGPSKLSELHLRLLVGGYVQLMFKTNDYRVVSAESFGNHWKVLVTYRDDSAAECSRKHLLAIVHDGRLIWEQAC